MQRAINVFNNNHVRFFVGLSEERAKLHVVHDPREPQVINIAFHVIGNGGDEASFPRSGWAVKKVATLPQTPNPLEQFLPMPISSWTGGSRAIVDKVEECFNGTPVHPSQ
ncbi:hypothetical protein SUGI_0502590 [Cryptomeria japonica]|nr:hypothetical protein SUGI_0502590 [Cryptomeria japonica]